MNDSDTAKKVDLIKNPLPMPKRSTPKVMEFEFEPSPEELKYDYEVADDADFDI